MACGAAPTLTFRNGPLWPLAWVKWAHRQASCLNTARLLQYPEAFIKSLQTYHAVQSFDTEAEDMASKPATPRRPTASRKRTRPAPPSVSSTALLGFDDDDVSAPTTISKRPSRERISTPTTASSTRPVRDKDAANPPVATSSRPTREVATPTTAFGASAAARSEPPPKRRRYIPGGAGGGGRFIEEDGTITFNVPSAMRTPRPPREPRVPATTATIPRRERSTRIRTAADHGDMEFSSAAAVAAAVAQNEGYKPREERGWEEFHPNLDIEATFKVFRSEEVDGLSQPPAAPATPVALSSSNHASSTPLREVNPESTGNTPNPGADSQPGASESPQKRRATRPTRESASYFSLRDVPAAAVPKTPQVLPIRNQTAKERLDLKAPSYRRSDRIVQFEGKGFGQARYVDKSMMNVGYQESDQYIRPERRMLKATDANVEDDMDTALSMKPDGEPAAPLLTSAPVGRVEYDMDEQDDMWLEAYNIERKSHELEPITREVFEIALTKIEKEWHALEKRIPKPNPKPPQTHRPRSSSAAAVNGEPQVGEEQDSKCAICDDGDCENTNAIVFCDGCDLAVHQECYGVPFIPEGQWLCRKCQLIGRGIPNSQGALAVLDNSMILKAYCDKHCPPDYTKENGVAQATRDAKRFYKKTMKGRIWADNQVVAHALAATHRHALTDHAPDESQMTGAKLSMMGDSKKGQPGKPIWKLPSGAPVIPRTVFDIVEMALSRFPFRKRKDFVSEACRYWTLKREARRGAALLKRLQLQMETFSSMELTRRNFAGMGPSGKTRLQRRIEFAETLLRDLEQLKDLSAKVVEREQLKLEAAELEQDFVDTCYFPVAKLFFPVVEKALALDKGVFYDGLVKLQSQLDVRFYTTTLAFAHDLCEVISVGINTEIKKVETADEELVATTLGKVSYEDPRQRKTLGKRILKAVQPQLETALRTEAEISSKPLDPLTKELEGMLEASIEFKSLSNDDGEKTIDADHDVVMADASIEEITVANGHVEKDRAEEGGDVDAMEVDAVGEEDDGSIEVATSNIDDKGKLPSSSSSVAGLEGNGKVAEQAYAALTNGVAGASDTPPASDGYQSNSAPEQPAPPTPPQSIGSLGAQSNDPLSEGGLAWHLKDFKLRGTTILADQWPGRDAIRSLSEELSDMDDRELEGLGFDVDDSTITASPNGAAASSEVIVDTIVSKAKASTRVRKKTRSSTRRR
ncbi:peregrin [Verticillium dahliae VdLs.17]|uniref:Peregrin n=1 Tax=Verticillium dahliae (strain VdLs.17 / ATCC MYA-4575 / FGSC 10137) TaxID=498257 RepID=G2X7G2_VERDV|nr:peregrin [Verticillium dahliae VdLs.17]EGY14930.1 peregrin [Verticillium dahliae VdLs.17]